MSSSAVLGTVRLGAPPWPTLDPFLFCVHHNDDYPSGTASLGPEPALLRGRNIGSDFAAKDGWSMYHGDVIPGFPRHPHRGFETVTIARRGLIDHSDSMGATARFGQGDVQWMTAGKGIVHSEMFPLVHRDQNNPTELFQIWLNLPAADKMVDPYFTMLWADTIPQHDFADDQGRKTQISVYAGALDGVATPQPPPNSWAARPQAGVAIWTVRMEPGAKCTLPAAMVGANRVLYFFDGESLRVEGQQVQRGMGIQLRADARVEIVNGPEPSELLMLQGKPIGDPVVQHGPFVMNTRTEIHQAIQDYQRTGFGGWPWKADGPVHPRPRGRFARHANGKEEEPSS